MAPPHWILDAISVWEARSDDDRAPSEDIWRLMFVGDMSDATPEDVRAAMRERRPLLPEGIVYGVFCACEIAVGITEGDEQVDDVPAALRTLGIALSDAEYTILDFACCSWMEDDYYSVVDRLCS